MARDATSALRHGLTPTSGVARDRARLSCGCEVRLVDGEATFTACREDEDGPPELMAFLERGLREAVLKAREMEP
jgi:hypothetical protein